MIWRLVALIGGALAILAGALLLSDASPLETLSALLRGSLGSPAAIAGTLRETSPLLLAGVAVFLALRAGLFNIGVEGQLLVGAAAGAFVATRIPGPMGIVLSLVAGLAAGALWAWPAGWIRAYRNGHEVITTIMLNNIALLLTSALVAGPLKDPAQESASTAVIGPGSRLPDLWSQPPVIISSALLMGVSMCLALALWLKRSVPGYELQAVGANRTAAEFAGINPRRVMVRAMCASGAVGGLAGTVQVLAYEGRFYSGFSPGYGFDALGVALLAGSNALGILPASLLFGILSKGGTQLQLEGVPKGLTTVVLGFLIILAAAIRYRQVKPVA